MTCRKLVEKDLNALSSNTNIQDPIASSSNYVENTCSQDSWWWLLDKQSWVAGIDSFVVLQDKLAKENDNGCQIFCCFFPADSGKVSITKPKDPSWDILILHLWECEPNGVCFRTINCDEE